MNSSLRIAQIAPSFHPLIGGIELYVFYLSKELVKRGHEVHVYTPNQVMKKRIVPKEAVIDGIRIHRLPVTFELTYRLKMWPEIFSRLLNDSKNLDVIHVQGHDHFYGLPSTVAGKIKDTPVVVTTYGPSLKQTEYSTQKRLFFETYDHLITPLIFQWSNMVLAKFPWVIEWIRSYGVPKSKIGLAPSGIPSECLKPRDSRRFKAKYDIKEPLILYIGRLSPQKGVHYLLEAMPQVVKEMPNATLVFIGPDYLNFKATLMKSSQKFHLEDHVIFMSPIRKLEEEMEAYASCDVFVMPSSFEGFSQAVHKAWTQKKPVVATNVGFLAQQVEHKQNGLLVNYGDSEALAKAIVSILQSPKLSETLGIHGREKATRYTFDRLAVDIEKIYHKTIARRF